MIPVWAQDRRPSTSLGITKSWMRLLGSGMPSGRSGERPGPLMRNQNCRVEAAKQICSVTSLGTINPETETVTKSRWARRLARRRDP